MSYDPKHPEMHVYEEGRDDFIDTAMGFAVFFIVLVLIAVGFGAVKLLVG